MTTPGIRRFRLGLLLALICVAVLVWWDNRSVNFRTLVMRSDPDTLLDDASVRGTLLSHGRQVFLAHCASCHGEEGKGDQRKAIPDLTDSDFLYGQNTVSQIELIVLHGIRAGDTKGWDLAEMPGFAKKIPYTREPLPSLTPDQISDLVGFLRAANGHGGYALDRIERGRKLFTTNAGCWDCHSNDAAGDPSIGAPDLVDGIWLKGNGSEADITETIEHGFANVSPAFSHILPAYDARSVAVYTASLHPPVKRASTS